MKKNIIIVLMLVSIVMLNADLTQRGFVRTHFGALVESGDYAVLQNTFDWRLDYGKGNVSLFVNPVFNYSGLDKELDINLRQAYFDIYYDNFDLRIGKQQIIWGKADGVFITDVISPRDLTEFILPEFEEIRIGTNAVKLNYYLGNSTVEAVWLPTFQPTITPDQNSIWFPKMDIYLIPVTFGASEEIEQKLSESEAALKYSYLGSAIDFELMTAYLWDDSPVMHVYPVGIDSLSGQFDGLFIQPKHHRVPLVGASFGKSVLGAVLRGEAAYYFDKNLAAENFTVNGVREKDYINYLIGYDHNWFGVNVSMQFVQEYILDYEEDIVNDEYQSTSTFLASKTYMNETLELSLFSYYGINDEDALLRPKLSYDLSDGFNILLGADIFVGEQGSFGQYDDNDMVYVKVRYDF